MFIIYNIEIVFELCFWEYIIIFDSNDLYESNSY